ncbi:MAG: SDR family NAD(P)-dependent oxidoreductase [Venatoribacter sp.]
MKSFTGKVAAITGAGSGMGRTLAIQLAKEGCGLALSDIDEKGLAATVEMVSRFGVRVTSTKLDVSNKEAVFAWADDTAKEHGKVNMIFNNAGVALSGTVPALKLEDYEWIMGINFWGVVYGTKAFLPHLEASGEGHIINTSSIFGLASQPLMSGYNASKFGVRGFTESLRQDLEISGSCVSASCVHPGGIKTNIAKTARMDDSSTAVTGVDKETSVREFEKLFTTTAEQAANVILNGVRKNKRRILIGADARMFEILVRIFPASYQWIFTKAIQLNSKMAAKKAAKQKSA